MKNNFLFRIIFCNLFTMVGIFVFFGATSVFAVEGDGTILSTVEINDVTLNGPVLADGDYYGIDVDNIGDLDGDGVDDIIVGASGDDAGGTSRGAAHIHFMNTDGSIKSTVEINDSTPNGPVLQDSVYYGYAVASIGDIDGDDIVDLAVSARGDDRYGANRGTVHIHFMNTDGSIKSTVEINDSTPNGPVLSLGDYFGISMAGIGDLDGDNVNDIAVGTRGDVGGVDRGAVDILFLNTDGSVKSTVEINSTTLNGPVLADVDNYGDAIANIGDLDGDGVQDIAVGAIGDDAGGSARGTVHIHFMNTDGSIKSTIEINDSTPNGPVLMDEDRYGSSVDNIGDLDGDGVDDIVVGAAAEDADGTINHGAAHIHFLNTDGSVKSTVKINGSTVNGPNITTENYYGIEVASLEDMDGNGVKEIVVTAHRDEGNGINRGAAHIHFMAIKLPEVTTTTATNIDEFTATLNANLTDIGGNGNPTRKIEYGTQSGVYTNECDATSGSTGTYSCNVENLQADTTYYYRAASSNGEDTAFGDELSFATIPLQDITIPNPQTSDIQDAIDDGRITLDNGTIDNTSQTTAQVNVTYTSPTTEALFPKNTQITEVLNQNFNFQNFTLEEVNVKSQQKDSRVAVRIGVPGEKLSFSQDITMIVYVGNAYNDEVMDILYQQEGTSTWQTQGTCTVENGNCTFTTNHATIYTINGSLQSTGDTPINLNTEVKDTLTLDCYDTAGSTGDYTVTLGTVTDPGKVTAGTPATGQSTCTVTTNDDQGYYLTLIDDNAVANTVLTHTDPHTGSTYEISDLTQYAFNTPNTINWNAPTTKGLGFSVITFPDTQTDNNTIDDIWTNTNQCPEGTAADTNTYAGIPDTAETISAVTQYESLSTTTNICYKVDVPASQASGQYTGSVTYTATSDASSYLN